MFKRVTAEKNNSALFGIVMVMSWKTFVMYTEWVTSMTFVISYWASDLPFTLMFVSIGIVLVAGAEETGMLYVFDSPKPFSFIKGQMNKCDRRYNNPAVTNIVRIFLKLYIWS